jgi:anti-sigma factor RsiW
MSCNKIQKGDLDAYVHGELSAVEAEGLEAHLFGCAFCVTELRHLRQEKRLFRSRADADEEQVPAFADILARINRQEAPAAANDVESNRVIALAKAPRPQPSRAKAELARSGEAKPGFSRWAQAFVACAATAAAAGSLLGVTPPKTDSTAIAHTRGEEMEIGADPICTPENSSASAEILVSVAPPREAVAKMPSPSNEDFGTCGGADVEECAGLDRICGEASSPVCDESGP